MKPEDLKDFMQWCVNNNRTQMYEVYEKELWKLIRMGRMIKIKRIFKV